jgi:hypothetical protein
VVVVSKLSHDRPRVEAPQNDRPFGRPRGEDVPSSVPVSYRVYWKFKHPSRQQRREQKAIRLRRSLTRRKKENGRKECIVPLATRRPPARQPFLDVLEQIRVVWVREQIVHFVVRVFPKSEEIRHFFCAGLFNDT